MEQEYLLIAGLGNPGTEYEDTRHNIGFMVLDQLFDLNRGEGKQVQWKEKSGAAICDVWLRGRKLHGVKPLQFMNVSGEPVQKLARFYKVQPQEIIVVHDELDLPFGTIRLKKGGGDAGHNGVKSITRCLGSSEFTRMRLGIGRPEDKRHSGAGWVLGKFGPDETDSLNEFLERAVGALGELLSSGIRSAQNSVHSDGPSKKK